MAGAANTLCAGHLTRYESDRLIEVLIFVSLGPEL